MRDEGLRVSLRAIERTRLREFEAERVSLSDGE